jgi:hypothetical protein
MTNSNDTEQQDRSAYIEAAQAAAFTITEDQTDDPSQIGRQVLQRGKDVACWCPVDAVCHGDVWLRLVNSDELNDWPVGGDRS